MDARRVIADLRELHELTGGPGGAQRVCWTDNWTRARDFLRSRLAELPGVEIEVDGAGNLWATLLGRLDPTVVVGSHIDSVPAGGWLDGALGLFGALEVLRSYAESGNRPERTIALVDWADEEGARFGHSLLGSSAFAGTLDTSVARRLHDSDGVALPDALAEHGVDIDAMAGAGEGRRDRLAAYLELHIEQGPVLEAEQRPCCAVTGCVGVQRHRVTFVGRAAHAGSTPMDRRHDAGLAAAGTIVGMTRIGHRHKGVATAGRLDLEPGIVTAVPGRAELQIDQRHAHAATLGRMLAETRDLWQQAASGAGVEVSSQRIWEIDPIPFHPGLVEAARNACLDVSGSERELPSGALHDAAQLAPIVPTVMVFASSTEGISHAPDEDTPERDLEQALEAYGRLADRVIAEGVPAAGGP